ncbi:hypothetical protein MIND_00217600 [Mycena indigotica]|uniref:Mitochondrial adapter protein MCP1 transmembrane domain-containing protein n=1 Tax=Mycena indigotica TaxID=2126181 RepID=A0A8H6T9Y7_9AGAR|nr:uncharacterized protein MIND_00217600 [Mycena indigotica]KAF7312055.1 hypothetical protein MIND_00217600 [Mycena indigotica]
MTNSSQRSFRSYAVPALTKILHGTAPFISSFLLIHLSAPMLANLGGSSLASQTMLLGREYYQTELGEQYLLLAPLVAHGLSGLAKRAVSPSNAPPRPWTSLLSLTGYANIVFFLPVHFMTHRVFPQLPDPPIQALGPSELDFEYVKFALTRWPKRSWFLYGGLVICVVLHTVEGQRLLFKSYFAQSMGRMGAAAQTRLRAIGLSLAALPVLSGLWVMSQEPLMAFPSAFSRFQASFTHSPFYRF